MSSPGKTKILEEEEILSILAKKYGKKNFCLIAFEVKPASDDPMGFLGEHYKLKVDVSVDGQTDKLSYFVKKIPTEVPQHLDYALKTRAFYKEIELYKTVFEDLRIEQGHLDNTTKWCPEYFYSRGEEILVLEDLSAIGYYMYPERCLMDENHVKASLRALAAMHAASLVFERRLGVGKKETLSSNTTSIGDIYSHLKFETEASDVKGHPGNTYHEAGIKSQVIIAGLLPRYSPEEKKLIQEKLPDVLRLSYQLVKSSERFKNVFIHGDLWSNNILFRKDDKGNVQDAILIDFQLARYAPPAHDVLMFLHLVQDRKFRQDRRQEMLDFYFTSLSEELQKNSLRVEEVFPREDFLESCEFYEDLGLICKLFYYQLILAPPAITSKFLSSADLFTTNMLIDRSEMVVECFLKDELCRQRVTEAMEEVVKKFILV